MSPLFLLRYSALTENPEYINLIHDLSQAQPSPAWRAPDPKKTVQKLQCGYCGPRSDGLSPTFPALPQALSSSLLLSPSASLSTQLFRSSMSQPILFIWITDTLKHHCPLITFCDTPVHLPSFIKDSPESASNCHVLLLSHLQTSVICLEVCFPPELENSSRAGLFCDPSTVYRS